MQRLVNHDNALYEDGGGGGGLEDEEYSDSIGINSNSSKNNKNESNSPLLNNSFSKNHNSIHSSNNDNENDNNSIRIIDSHQSYSQIENQNSNIENQKKKSIKNIVISTVWVVVWITLNMSLFFGNKYLDDIVKPNFQYPVLVILTGTFATFIGSFIAVFVFKISSFPIDALKQHKLLLLLVSLFQAFTYVLENYSIVGLSISLNQIIKSTGPVFIIVIGFILYRETHSIQIILSTLVLILGVTLSVFHNPGFKLWGSLYALGSVIFAAVQTLLIAKLLKDPKLNTLAIVVATSFPSAITCLVLFFITGEYSKLQKYNGPATIPTIGVILLAVAACFYNLSHFYIVQYTSALYYVIIGNIKVILLIIVSFFVFKTNTQFTTVNIIGMIITMLGFLIYNYFKYYEKLGRKPPIFSILSPSKFKYSQIEDLSRPTNRQEDVFSINSEADDDYLDSSNNSSNQK